MKVNLDSLPYCKTTDCVYLDESEILYPLGTKDVLVCKNKFPNYKINFYFVVDFNTYYDR